MKTVLCYGDSNTWGWDAFALGRHPRHVRWPGVLQAALGEDFYVIEEGLNGRTTVWDDPIELHKNGATYLIPCLESHKPLDLVVLMLGSNDLKMRYSVPAYDIAAGASRLVDMILRSRCGPDDGTPQVLLLSPPPLGDMSPTPHLDEMFTGAAAKADRLAYHYVQVAQEQGCAYLDTTTFWSPARRMVCTWTRRSMKNWGSASPNGCAICWPKLSHHPT
ncbi:SGNH/GDSL hydrolase family protein [Chloroflexota bacterium]